MPVIQRPSIIEAVQNVSNQSPVKRLGKNEQGITRCPKDVFTGLKPAPLPIRRKSSSKFTDLKALDEECVKDLVDISRLHEALNCMHKDVAETNVMRCTSAQKIHNASTNVLPLNICVGDHVMSQSHAHKSHKVQTMWRDLMRVDEAKSSLVFVVEDLINDEQLVVHAKRMLRYRITKRREHASEELWQQAAHYDMSYHPVDQIERLRKRKGNHGVLVNWLHFDDDDDGMTWEPLGNL